MLSSSSLPLPGLTSFQRILPFLFLCLSLSFHNILLPRSFYLSSLILFLSPSILQLLWLSLSFSLIDFYHNSALLLIFTYNCLRLFFSFSYLFKLITSYHKSAITLITFRVVMIIPKYTPELCCCSLCKFALCAFLSLLFQRTVLEPMS